MKTVAEITFDRVIKEGFQAVLKPLGFKKKGNNFYLQLEDLGQIINVQKSVYYSKNFIHYTINTGLFIPEYWLTYFNYHDNVLPVYPTEPVCLVRKRIGELRKQQDTWYDIDEKTDVEKLIAEMGGNLHDFILPYFERAKTKQDFLLLMESGELGLSQLEKLIVYGENKMWDKAKEAYELLLEENRKSAFLASVKEYGKKYGFE